MKKAKRILMGLATLSLFTMGSCKKCSECHYYDVNGKEVEFGERCGKDLKDIEKNGYDVSGKNLEVHCGH